MNIVRNKKDYLKQTVPVQFTVSADIHRACKMMIIIENIMQSDPGYEDTIPKDCDTPVSPLC